MKIAASLYSFAASVFLLSSPAMAGTAWQYCTIYNYDGLTMDVTTAYETSYYQHYHADRIRHSQWSLAAFSDECVRRAEEVCSLPSPMDGKGYRISQVVIATQTIAESPYPRIAPGNINVLSGIDGMVVNCPEGLAEGNAAALEFMTK